MCESEEIRHIHKQTNDEICDILAALTGHAGATSDKDLEALVENLRQVLTKRFLINGIADWQREGE